MVVTVGVPGPWGNALDPELDICTYSGEYIRVAVETVHSNHSVPRYICLSVLCKFMINIQRRYNPLL